MNIPMPTWTMYVVHQGKIVKVGDHTGITPPKETDVKKASESLGYESYSDFMIRLVDDGREC